MAAVEIGAGPRWQRAPRARLGEKVAGGILILILLVLVAYPLASLLYGSVTSQGPNDQGEAAFSLANFARIFSDPQFWLAWKNTLIVSFGSAIIAIVCGLAAALVIVRTDLPARGLFETLIIIPVFISPFIGAVAWSGLGAPRVGLLNRLFDVVGIPIDINIYSLTGIAIVLGLYMTPYVFLFTSGPLASIDATMEEASRLSGQSAFATLRRVTIPLVTPSIMAAGLLIVVLSMENFGVLAVLGMPTQIPFISTEIYLKFAYPPVDYAYSTVVSLTLIAVTALGLASQRYLMSRKSFVSIGGKSYRPVLIKLGKWRWIITALLSLFVLIAIILPLATMVMASFQSYWTSQLTNFTLQNYATVFTRGPLIDATKNSLFLAVLGAFVACALAGAIAYVVNRTRAPGRHLIDLMSSISVAIPGVVLGVALLWAWIRVPLPIYGTIWVLLIAYVTRFLTFGVRNISASLSQVGEDLENAARVAGASKSRAALTVTLPLVRRSFISSWVIYFISFLKELNTSVLLYSFGSVVLPVIIFDAYMEGNYPQVAALATGISVLIFAVITVASMLFGIKIRPKG